MRQTTKPKRISNNTWVEIAFVVAMLLMVAAVASPTVVALIGGHTGNPQAKLDGLVRRVVAQTNNDKAPTSKSVLRLDMNVAITAVPDGFNSLEVVRSRVTSSGGSFTVRRAWSSPLDCLRYSDARQVWSYTTGACRL